jgi:hypothetical protein
MNESMAPCPTDHEIVSSNFVPWRQSPRAAANAQAFASLYQYDRENVGRVAASTARKGLIAIYESAHVLIN